MLCRDAPEEYQGDNHGRCGRKRDINWRQHRYGPVTVTYVDSNCAPTNGGVEPTGSSRDRAGLSLEVRTMAHAVVIPTIRTLVADLATRADFDLDSIDDLRMAVDDLCVMLTRIAAADATLSCVFTVQPERIEVAAEVDVDSMADPLPTGSFGWRMLECLVNEVSAMALPQEPGREGRVRITLTKDAVREQS